jgi:hypothetical protein
LSNTSFFAQFSNNEVILPATQMSQLGTSRPLAWTISVSVLANTLLLVAANFDVREFSPPKPRNSSIRDTESCCLGGRERHTTDSQLITTSSQTTPSRHLTTSKFSRPSRLQICLLGISFLCALFGICFQYLNSGHWLCRLYDNSHLKW